MQVVHNFGLWRQLFDMLDIYILPSKPNIQVKAPLPSPHPSEVQDRFSVLIINLVCPRCWAGLQCREIIYTIYSIYSIYTIYTILLLSTLPTLCTRSTLSTTSVLSRISILSTQSKLSTLSTKCCVGVEPGLDTADGAGTQRRLQHSDKNNLDFSTGGQFYKAKAWDNNKYIRR